MSAAKLTVSGSGGAVMTEVVASLPESYVRRDTGGAEIAVVDGADGWAERAESAIRLGALGVIVIDPDPVEPQEIDSLAAAASRVPLLLSEGWACNPTVLGVADRWRHSLSSATVVETAAVDGTHGVGQEALIFRQLRVLRRLGFADVDLKSGATTDEAHSWTGTASNGARVVLFGARSSGSQPALTIAVTSAAESVQLSLTSGRTARPASAWRLSATGGELFATIYQTAHRHSFVRMRALIASGGRSDDLAAFSRDATTAVLVRSRYVSPVPSQI